MQDIRNFLNVFLSVTSPLILLVLAGVAFTSHKIRKADTPLSVFGYQLSTGHQIVALSVASVPILFLVGAETALIWTLGKNILLLSTYLDFKCCVRSFLQVSPA